MQCALCMTQLFQRKGISFDLFKRQYFPKYIVTLIAQQDLTSQGLGCWKLPKVEFQKYFIDSSDSVYIITYTTLFLVFLPF